MSSIFYKKINPLCSPLTNTNLETYMNLTPEMPPTLYWPYTISLSPAISHNLKGHRTSFLTRPTKIRPWKKNSKKDLTTWLERNPFYTEKKVVYRSAKISVCADGSILLAGLRTWVCRDRYVGDTDVFR